MSPSGYPKLEVIQSLPSRGAWIEIALLFPIDPLAARRSPHGERGLKSPPPDDLSEPIPVAPLTGSVD